VVWAAFATNCGKVMVNRVNVSRLKSYRYINKLNQLSRIKQLSPTKGNYFFPAPRGRYCAT
jgi:hypothetical protein